MNGVYPGVSAAVHHKGKPFRIHPEHCLTLRPVLRTARFTPTSGGGNKMLKDVWVLLTGRWDFFGKLL